jgi:septal ring factor EnvC (AmiA/AmiB activator)
VTWVSILSAGLSVFKLVLQFFRRKELLDEGARQAKLKGLQDANATIDQAREAREAARADAARNPADTMRDDEYTRAD